MKLKFFGGAQAVTGANYLLQATDNRGKDIKILIDCGLSQGGGGSKEKNYEKFPYNPAEIEAVLITHAHIDHTGRLPLLYKSGFRGKIFSTCPTKDFSEQLLIDSQGLLEKEAEKEGRAPLYTLHDVEGTMHLWTGISYHEKVEIGPLSAEFFDAGHILGSSFIKIIGPGEDGSEKTIVFSGDLGNTATPLVRDTESPEAADYVIMESLYGDKFHEEVELRKDKLEDAIEEAVASGGVLMIPAFAMERTQELLYEINELTENRRIPRVPIFIDSPLAIKLISIYEKYSDDPEYFDDEAMALFHKGDEIFNFPGLTLALTTAQSKEINNMPPPKVIIAGSGMSEGGRMIHHEYRYLPDPNSTVLFISYQSPNSLGRRILDGDKVVKIFGEDVLVRCRVKSIGGYSAHADQKKLLDWLRSARHSAKRVFLVQSEPKAAEIFAVKVRDDLALDARVPEDNEEAIL